VAGAVGHRFRPYSGCAPSRLWRGPAAAAALILALACGGCSLSYQLDSFFGGNKTTTGSIEPPPGAKDASKLPPDGDLAYARAAASEVLRRGKKDASLPWENPRSGARGTVTPIASAYTQDGHTCRNFLASYVNGDAEAWLQGEACEQGKDSWEVRSLKPWTRS
jgi:17 kDa outer membrane surface antigen